MKKSVYVAVFMAVSSVAFAEPLLNEDNINLLTSALVDQGFTVSEIAIDGDFYEVLGERDGQIVIVQITEDFEIVSVEQAPS